MRILQIGKYYHPSHGGIETVLRNLSEGLVRADDEVTVLCSAESLSGGEEWVHGVRVLRTGRMGSLASQPLSPALPLRMRQLASRFDIIHLHSPNPLTESGLLALPKELPVVVTYHSDVIRQKRLLPFYRPVLSRALARAAKIVVATENHIRYSEHLKPFQEKCAVIPFGLDPAQFVPTPSVEKAASELKRRHGRFILFVGRLVGYKGLTHLIEAMKEVQGADLVIIGDGPLRDELSTEAVQAGVGSRVHFEGEIDDTADLTAYYRACDAVILPSVTPNEAFGMVLLEAMACSKPAVYSRLRSGISLVNEDGVTGLGVEPASAGDLASALNSLLSNDSRREEMGRAARARFEALYTRDRMVASYRDLYEDMIES